MSQTIGAPSIPQGFLNRIRGNVQIVQFPGLNVTASFLGEGGFEITWSTPATTMIPTMTGLVVSPEPYQRVNIGIHLVKSLYLAQAWENQRVSNSAIGPILVFTDSSQLSPYGFITCAIENVAPIVSNGKSAEYMVTLTGVYTINNYLWAVAF